MSIKGILGLMALTALPIATLAACGQDCDAFLNDTDGEAITFRIINNTGATIIVTGNGCANELTQVFDPEGEIVAQNPGFGCGGDTCEALQEEQELVGCEMGGACLEAVTQIKDGAANESAWDGVTVRTMTMPRSCAFDASDDVTCRQVAPAPNGEYRAVVQADRATPCTGSACTCLTPDGVSGQVDDCEGELVTLEPLTAEATFKYGNAEVQIVFE